ncbi:MAG: hypothetical protein WC974_04100 [Thermoplasmata archaeon]
MVGEIAVSDDVKKGIDLTDAEELLKHAKLALDSEQTLKSLSYTRQAKNTAREAVKKYQEVLSTIQSAQKSILKSESEGVDITKAVELLNQAKTALINTQYDEAINLAYQSIAATKPQPLIGYDVLLRTALGYEDGRIKYKVEIKNQTTYPLRRVRVKSLLPDSMFICKNYEKVVSIIKPYDGAVVTFNGKLRDEFEKNIDYNVIVPGRDLAIQTTTSSEEGAIVHKIRIENKRLEPILALHIKPFIPSEFTATPEEHVIDKLGPSETGILVFKLMSRTGGMMPKPEVAPERIESLQPQIEAPFVEEKTEEPMIVAVQREPSHELSPEEVDKLPSAPKKTIYECPKCKGPFVIEADGRTPVVGCPWCGIDVNIGEGTPTASKDEEAPKPTAPTQTAEEETPQPTPTPQIPEIKPVEDVPVMAPVDEAKTTVTPEIDDKQQQNLKSIFENALMRLNDNEDYHTVMTNVYENISTHLEKFVSADKNFDTFEDFRAVCKKNLKIEGNTLDIVLDTLDDAFYGSGESDEKKKKSIELFTNVVQTLAPQEMPKLQPVEEDEGKKKRFWKSKKKK